MERYLSERLESFVQPVLRYLESKPEVAHYEMMDRFGMIRLSLNLTEFVERGLIQQVEAPFRFAKKSNSEMIQPAYQGSYTPSGMSIEDMM